MEERLESIRRDIPDIAREDFESLVDARNRFYESHFGRKLSGALKYFR
jgi:hypothetical protein